MVSETIALGTIVAISLFLLFLFFFLLGYTFWTRKKRTYWEDYEEKFRDLFLPLLMEYSESADQHDPDIVIKKLTKRKQDIVFFLNLISELKSVVKGEQEKQLKQLVRHNLFFQFYRKKLFTLSKKNQMLACIYFSNTGHFGDRITARLISITKGNNTKLAFAAAKALQQVDDISIRKNTFIRFLRRDDISELMITELLHAFDRRNPQQRSSLVKAFKDILKQKISPGYKNIVVRYIGHQNFFECSDFLLQYLNSIAFTKTNIPLVNGLIKALDELHIYEAAPIIRNCIERDDINDELRLQCIGALSTLGDEEDLRFLVDQLLSVDFDARKVIIANISQRDDIGMKLLNGFLLENLDFISNLKRRKEIPVDIKDRLLKIIDTAKGIRIILSYRAGIHHA